MGGMPLEALRFRIPLAKHDAAGPITKRSSANHISITPILSEGSEKETHYLVASYIKRPRALDGPLDVMWTTLLQDC